MLQKNLENRNHTLHCHIKPHISNKPSTRHKLFTFHVLGGVNNEGGGIDRIVEPAL